MKKYAILALTAVMATSILTVPAKALPTQPQGIVEGGCVLPVPNWPPKDYCDIEPMNRGFVPYFERDCKPGDRDLGPIMNDVQFLQCRLTHIGYDDLDEVGYFGPKTENAVKDFQEKHGLETDGIVTPNVWKVLRNVL
ncbi:peptidoglycan-binding domain-containing protein [Clostridium sp.]|uniref:peptidoglycan-binding domain-containing protein n=1 Tax=Clostridium sp. TaxID=1506 RepID=UPI0028A2DB54|nr:peptidoglycan-binding domain-containing protein [Clostridium sp.]